MNLNVRRGIQDSFKLECTHFSSLIFLNRHLQQTSSNQTVFVTLTVRPLLEALPITREIREYILCSQWMKIWRLRIKDDYITLTTCQYNSILKLLNLNAVLIFSCYCMLRRNHAICNNPFSLATELSSLQAAVNINECLWKSLWLETQSLT